MTKEQLDLKLAELETLPEVTPDQLQDIIVAFIDYLQTIIKNDKIDEILENIENRVENDRFGVLAFIVNFIKLKRQG